MIVKLSENAKLAAIVKRAFPDYRKRSVILHRFDSVSPTGMYWSGGSKSEYFISDIDGGNCRHADIVGGSGFPSFKTGDDIPTDADTVVYKSGIFCGKPATLSVFVSPSVDL